MKVNYFSLKNFKTQAICIQSDKLRKMFSFVYIYISVFPSSRTAVLRKWKMLGQERGGCQGGISLTDFRLFNRDYTCDIFVEDAQKMLIQAGPFFKYLQMIFGNIDSTVLFIEIGIPKLDNCFWYKVVGANVNSLVETLCMLFKNVTTIFTHSTCLNHFCERGITDGVKVLECYFVKPTDEFHCNSFKGVSIKTIYNNCNYILTQTKPTKQKNNRG